MNEYPLRLNEQCYLGVEREQTKKSNGSPINPVYFLLVCKVVGILLGAAYIYFNGINSTSPKATEQQRVIRYETIDSRTH